ncbi:hypothetical protein MLD38_023831 [Melastoma candidum]|uniref:Uncharacterized protein n=1 Tax=Melastoma candidum TaxID=119954 RepID=A0ACB9NQB0_9MYRT|nr:hypothetical protein MLD38_023831 [Melastoma candidum]
MCVTGRTGFIRSSMVAKLLKKATPFWTALESAPGRARSAPSTWSQRRSLKRRGMEFAENEVDVVCVLPSVIGPFLCPFMTSSVYLSNHPSTYPTSYSSVVFKVLPFWLVRHIHLGCHECTDLSDGEYRCDRQIQMPFC